MILQTILEFKNYFIGLICKINKQYVYFAAIHFIVSFFSDNFIIQYANVPVGRLVFVKLIFLIFLILIWQLAAYVIANYKKSEKIHNYLFFTLIYFNAMLLILILFFPGNIKEHSDFFYLAKGIRLETTLLYEPVIMEYFRFFSFMLFPCIAGIAISQLLVISLIVGFVISEFYSIIKSKLIYLLYLPFFMFLVIENNLFIDTCIIYSYLMLLLFMKLLLIKINNQKINTGDIIIMGFLPVLLANLRAEGIVILIAVPVMFLMDNYKKYDKKQLIQFMFILIFSILIFFPKYIDTYFQNEGNKVYGKLFILDGTFDFLLKKAVDEKNKNILSEFSQDKTLKLELLMPPKANINMDFYMRLKGREIDEFNHLIDKLMKNYRAAYLKRKLHGIFVGVYDQKIYKFDKQYEFKDNLPVKPLYDSIEKMLKVNFCFRNNIVDFVQKLINKKSSIHVPFYILCFIMIVSAVLLKKTWFFISFLTLLHGFLVVVFAPYGMFRYVFNIYLIGYAALIIFIVFILDSLINKKKLTIFI